MSWRINLFIWKIIGRRFKITIDDCLDSEYYYMVEDDRIDIKNFHSMMKGTVGYSKRRRMLKKRRNWYIRHGFLELADDINTALWKRTKT